jgi:hypothetical protein
VYKIYCLYIGLEELNTTIAILHREGLALTILACRRSGWHVTVLSVKEIRSYLLHYFSKIEVVREDRTTNLQIGFAKSSTYCSLGLIRPKAFVCTHPSQKE